MQNALELTKNEIILNKRALEVEKQVQFAKYQKELEMLMKFEKWLDNIEDEKKREIEDLKEQFEIEKAKIKRNYETNMKPKMAKEDIRNPS